MPLRGGIMGLLGWIFYIFIAFVMFIVIKFLDNKYKFTKLEKLIVSLIILLFVSGLCYKYAIKYTDNIFLVFVFVLVIDVIYNSYFIEKDFFDKNENNILYYVVLVLLAFFINQTFINEVTQVFLTGEDLRILLWAFSFIFIYSMCKNRKIFSNTTSTVNNNISRNMVLVNYAKLKDKYYDECNYSNKDISNIIYSLMIYENHKRSKILRNYDYFVFRLNGKKSKLGIMQVESNKYITDVESIELVHKKIEKIYDKKKTGKKVNIESIIKEYDKENYENIMYIFDIIKKF